MNEYDDDPLVRALRAPGTADELGGEEEALRAYRAAFPGHRGGARRAIGRLGLGGGTFVLSIALGGGVAAAYTQTLPEPVQRFAHQVLGPVGVPAVKPKPRPLAATPVESDSARAPEATPPPADPAPSTPPSSPPATTGAPGPGERTPKAEPGERTSPVPSPGQPSPSAPSPSPEPTPPVAPPTVPPTTPPTTEPEPEPEPPRAKPAAVGIAVSQTRVESGSVVTVTGTVTDEAGVVVADRRVRFAYRTADGQWQTFATATSGPDGAVSFTTPPVTENVATRLVAGKRIRSDRVRLRVKPEVSVSLVEDRIAATIIGGQVGDAVVLTRVTNQGRKQAGLAMLAEDGTVSFVIRPPERRTRFVVGLPRTPRHLGAAGSVVVRRVKPVDPQTQEENAEPRH